ncbi:MAG: nitronate monooxygenase [Oxalobacter sp.]|nr:MAG: nitronate monooxygenase [Oxalobacter sp.]
MKRVDDFRLRLGKKELVPIVIGGMGVDISTEALALEAARLGGIGTISDAMIVDVSDRLYGTNYTKQKARQYRQYTKNFDKTDIKFNLDWIIEATRRQVRSAMSAKRGDGLVFTNCMEKLTMNAPKETLQARLTAALDEGIDGITLSAGLHQNSFRLIEDHPRFRDAKLGIIVSSHRALHIFLRRNARLNRLPDFIVVEGPLAGGHLGFGMDWANYDLATIVAEVMEYLKGENLDIPVIPAGGIFTGSDAVAFLEKGAAAVQVATRFTVANECGLPDATKQEYFKASEDDIEVNEISPTGYPMRMLKKSPARFSAVRPNCEPYGYLLEDGKCQYITAYERELKRQPNERKVFVTDKTCLCTYMRNDQVWTCGHTTYRLKDTTNRLPDGSYQRLSAEHIFKDYQFSNDNKIMLPKLGGV